MSNWEYDPRDSLKIFCLPYAGGGASVFRNWQSGIPDNIGICPVQLPGREDRICEKPIAEMKKITSLILEELSGISVSRFLLFGHSMGAKIAYEIATALQEMKGADPQALIVSGSQAPFIPERNVIHDLEGERFIEALRKFGGTPEEILSNPDLIEFFTPLLKADFALDENYLASQKRKKLDCPIFVFRGDEDKEVEPEEAEAWRECTSNKCTVKVFHGGHFFIRTAENEVLKEIRDIISELESNNIKNKLKPWR